MKKRLKKKLHKQGLIDCGNGWVFHKDILDIVRKENSFIKSEMKKCSGVSPYISPDGKKFEFKYKPYKPFEFGTNVVKTNPYKIIK